MDNGVGYSFKDVYIIPQYTEVDSRSKVDTSSFFQKGSTCLTISTPAISANMDSVTGPEMAVAMWKAGAIGALHRFWSVADNVAAYEMVGANAAECFVSVGIHDADRTRAIDLWNSGARYFIVDIAHGHSLQMKQMLGWLKTQFNDIYVMAGNVATPEAVVDLEEWGADSIKVGIGPGAACLTKNVTGVTYPQFTAIRNCVNVAKVPIVADGGCTEIGDIAKALGAGASLVMLGRMLAGCIETPSIMIDGHKIYRGMASRDAMKKIRNGDDLPTPEGTSIIINDNPITAMEAVKGIGGGLKSAFSYCNATTLEEFQSKVKFGVRN